MDTIHTDTWILSLPEDWTENEPLGAMDAGVLYFESLDGEKGMYISVWNLGEGSHPSAKDVADSFKATEIETLHEMEGYSWQIMEERLAQHETSATTVIDCFAPEQNYRIAGKILAAPPIVVRASFHDYACSDYAASKAYFAPIIESLCLCTPAL
ncbi:MAG: hypothetical protein LBC37_00955 [Zoogloeaceae bacterium]|jgi:hypothetical protein|nr:hypothetical protein [Zoogloeaceae bacterium]